MEKNDDSRLGNTLRNFKFGAAAQLVVTLLGFVSRTVFIRVLGMEYSGVNGLYTSILDVLSLTELSGNSQRKIWRRIWFCVVLSLKSGRRN